MQVLVTGGCGLIGYHAAKYYHERGHDVQVMDNLERSSLLGHKVSSDRVVHNRDLLTKMGVSMLQTDVSELASWTYVDATNPPELIVHLAAQCGVPTSIENPRRDFEVNVLGTFNALECARKHNATLVFSSTNKVYPIHDAFVKRGDRWHFADPEWAENGFPVVNDLVGSRTPYGWSKYSADMLCQEYYHTYGVKTGVFRMSCIYGTHQFGFEEQGWATWFVIAALKGLPITIYGDGCQVRDMLYVSDVIDAYDAFVESSMSHGVFNLGGGPQNAVSLKDTLSWLDVDNVTYEDWRPSDQKVYITDIRPTMEALSWYPLVIPEKGLERVQHWVEDNLELF